MKAVCLLKALLFSPQSHPTSPHAPYTHQVLGSAATRCKVPTLVLYGNKDWLDYEGVEKDVEAWGQAGSDVTLLRVNNGGHNFFLENPEGFHEHMRGWEAKEKERDAAAVV